MAEIRPDGKHTLMLEKRNKLSLTGVLDVISFDEDTVAANTDCGVIVIKGDELHIDNLNLEKGDLSLEGMVYSIVYEDNDGYSGGRTSMFSRLFR